MKFERETNLYQDQALARKFKSQDTEFEIIQGHINAMISESEIRELVNGGKTMYSAMNDINVDVKGLTANLSELHSTVDGNSGQITELDSKQAEYEATLERFSGSLTQVNKDLTGVTGRVTTVEGTAEGLKTSVSEFNTKIANKIDTYFYGYAPTLNNIPASGWDTTELKEAHKDAIFYDTSTGYCYRFTKSGQSYSWVRVKDSDIASAMQAASDAQDTADGKVVTYAQNDPPTGNLVEGDLWIDTNDRNKLYRWNGVKWNAYSDSSSLNAWLVTYDSDKSNIEDTMDDLQTQIDGKVETWAQTTDPSASWTTSAIKNLHKGDLWYNTTSNVQKYYRYNGSTWVEITAMPPADLVTTINGKGRIFTTEPTTPYSVGDLWVQGASGEIMRCTRARASGNYTETDWSKASKYTDDSTLNTWLSSTYAADKENILNQLDGKIETYYQPDNNDPSAAWTTDKLKQNHIGDMWYKSTTGKYVRWNGIAWVEITATPSNDVMFLINAKARIFTIQPIPPYYEGDLWLKSDTQDIYQCVNMRTKGSFVDTDWTYASKYTDDTVANNVANNLRDNYSTTTQITQNSNGIMTEAISHVDGKHYISQINQTADSVQIKADKINLTGVTTFARADVALEGSQRIYATARSTESQYRPVAPTEWVTNTSYTHGVWTTERPAYDSDYPILYTLTQKKTTNGSISNSSVLRDMAMTVIDGDSITTGTIDADYVDVINIDASNINTGYLNADRISGGTIDANDVIIKNLDASEIKSGYLSANRISGGTLDANDVTVKNLSASSINGGTMSANYISGGTLDFNNITTKNLSASDITTGSMSANRISGGTLSVGGGDSVGRITVKDSSGSNYGFWDSGSLNIGPNNQFHVDNLGQVWCQYLSITEESGNGSVVINSNDSWSHIYLNNGRLQSRSLDVTGTKSRVAETEDYGKRLLYCYETPTPMFGDVGDAVVAEDGLCYIQIDPTFAETISTNQYQVFLQRYGEGDCYVKERHNTYFVVKGIPGLEFGWEIKAKQLGFSQLRLDWKNVNEDVDTRNSVNYEEDAIKHINEINYGRITA